MKNSVFVALLLVAIIFQSCDQEDQEGKVPNKVTTSFNQKFTNAEDTEWEMESENEWEAEFKVEGRSFSANFEANGKWTETEYSIKDSEIPSDIRAILDLNLTDFKIEKIEVAETPEGKSYEFEIEQGEEKFEVVIDSKRNFTSEKTTTKNMDYDVD